MAYQFPLNGGRINASIGGNSTSAGAGYSVVSTGTLLLAGGNNITLSQNGSAITISGANAPSGSVNFSASNTSANLASVTFSNSNGVSFGLNAGVITASHNGLSSQSNQALSGSNGSYTFQTATFGNLNGLSFYTSNGSMVGSYSVPTQTVQTQNLHNVTLSGNTAGAMAHISSGTLTLAGGNNITLSQNGNAITISGGAGGGGGIALANSQTTYTSGTAHMSVVGGALTIASTTGQSFNFSAPATSSIVATGAVSVAANVSTISIGAPAFSMGMSNIGNTAGTSGTASNQIIFAGGNNITLSQSTAAGGHTITISGGAGGGGMALANSQTTYATGTAHFVEGGGAITIASTTGQSFRLSVPATSSLSVTGGISLSTNGSTISIGAPAQSQLSATGIVSISNNGSTISIGASIPISSMSFYQNMDRGTTATLAVPFASMMLQRLNQENNNFAANLTANTVLLNMTANMTATSLSTAHTVSVSIGIYSDNATNLSLINSASTTWGLAANTGNTSNYNGPRWLSFASSQWSSAPVLLQGGEYAFGLIVRTSSYAPPLSFYGQNYMMSNQRSGFIGTSLATNTTLAQGNYWNGVMNTTALPTGITSNQVNRNNASAVFIPHIILNNRYSGTF